MRRRAARHEHNRQTRRQGQKHSELKRGHVREGGVVGVWAGWGGEMKKGEGGGGLAGRVWRETCGWAEMRRQSVGRWWVVRKAGLVGQKVRV